ncbi:MAG: hypothetical protein HY710_16465 [Candidatus Latescibacteria bacterium]|nr:hypothetical protein [Candidatus Latescibacterota bacterium]
MKHPELDETLAILLAELGEECQRTLQLLAQLRLNHLTADQMGDILAELTGSVVHLHVHTEGLQELISDELERL